MATLALPLLTLGFAPAPSVPHGALSARGVVLHGPRAVVRSYDEKPSSPWATVLGALEGLGPKGEVPPEEATEAAAPESKFSMSSISVPSVKSLGGFSLPNIQMPGAAPAEIEEEEEEEEEEVPVAKAGEPDLIDAIFDTVVMVAETLGSLLLARIQLFALQQARAAQLWVDDLLASVAAT